MVLIENRKGQIEPEVEIDSVGLECGISSFQVWSKMSSQWSLHNILNKWLLFTVGNIGLRVPGLKLEITELNKK